MNGITLIEAVYRAERTRVLATAIRVAHGDFDLAEEIVQETFATAVTRWPVDGVPDDPLAWLITVARHKIIDAIRRNVRLRHLLASAAQDQSAVDVELTTIPDDRLRLIFTCCHPAMASENQIALTLHTLCGLTTEEIARAFLVSTATMSQRLVRAKQKIRNAGIPYEVPAASELTERLDRVLEVIYLIFNEGYAATGGDDWVRRDLCREAIRLGRILLELTHATAAAGLLALMLLQDSRRDARTDGNGDLILLEDQDRTRWDRAQIDEALTLVPVALRGGADVYALQAAIAALHATAIDSASTDWPQIVALFAELMKRAPTPVAALNQAVAVAMCRGPQAGLDLVEPLRPQLDHYHLWHAARAELLRRLDRRNEARDAYRSALELAGSAPEQRFLRRRLRDL